MEPAETRSVTIMTAHAFFMGCATAFFETAASATFLARFAPSYLPWVYVAAAGVNTLTGTVYSRAHARVPFARLMSGTLWLLLALTVSVRVGLALSSLRAVAFAALVAYRVLSSLTDLEYWAVASRIYDVRQAKRLFGLIGTGEVVARIVASFSVPLLVHAIGVGNLMLLSAASLAICALLVHTLLGTSAEAGPTPSSPPASQASPSLRTFLGQMLQSRYLSLVVGVAVLATFGKYFVDFAFLEQMSTRARGEAEVAGLLGLFSGLTQAASLLTRLLVSRPLLHRFGVRAGVVLLPALQVLATLGIVVSGALGLGESAVFAFVVVDQGIYKTFKHPIDNASFKVLYQPLRPQQRLAAQIAVEVLFAPLVAGVSGSVMLLFTRAMPYEPVRFALVLLATFVAWTLTARAAGRRYVETLTDTLRLGPAGEVVTPVGNGQRAVLERELAVAASAATTLVEARAADAEIALALDRLFELLAVLYGPVAIRAAAAHVAHASRDKRAYARELLDVTLTPAHRRLVLPLLESKR